MRCDQRRELASWSTCRVLWGTDNSVHKCFTLHAPVLHKAVWATFPEYGHRDVLCLLHATSVTTAVLGGTLHDTPLPGPVQALWPCTQGLLLVVSDPYCLAG